MDFKCAAYLMNQINESFNVFLPHGKGDVYIIKPKETFFKIASISELQ